MTFDEAVQIIDKRTMINGSFGLSPNVTKKIVAYLKKEYAPTVEMTKEDKKTLEFYLENSTFFSLIECKHDGVAEDMLGITVGGNEFLNLSDEDLMQAWLHPETIKVVDE